MKTFRRSLVIIAFGIASLVPTPLRCQPYNYFEQFPTDSNGVTNILRFNFSTGTTEVFLTGHHPGTGALHSDETQAWLYYWAEAEDNPQEGHIMVINTAQPNLKRLLPDEVALKYTMGLKFSPQLNRLYVASEAANFVYDGSTLARIDSFGIDLITISEHQFLSEDGTVLFFVATDSTNKKASLTAFSLLTKKILSRKPLDLIGPPVYKLLLDTRKDKFLFGFHTPGGPSGDTQYMLYDGATDLVTTPIHFYVISEDEHLSGDGKYLIVHETPPDPNYKPGDKYYHIPTGKISIFEFATQSLVQKMELSPGGKVIVFQNYPNMFYYFLEDQNKTIKIDLTKLPAVSSLTPLSVSVGSSGLNLLVSGHNFLSTSVINWNGSPRATAFINDSTLEAPIPASDVAAVDSPLVTVRNGDGTAESNSLRFYVTQSAQGLSLVAKVVNSTGASLLGASLQYFEGSWKDAINNNDGTFAVNTSQTTTSLRMTYAYGSQTKSNILVNSGPITFQTVNTQVKLQNSQGTLMDRGTVQYYAGAWRDFGATANGVATMELLPASYSFRMTYAYGSNDKLQDIGSNSVVVFQTVNTAVQMRNSQGTLMDAGTVQYYAGAWRDFGSTTNGVATKELLPATYSFRMTYAFASKDMQQNVGTNPTVVFSTVNALVQLKNSLGDLIDQGTVQYYAGAWRPFGTTTNGSAARELLPNNYSFRLTYEFVSNDKAQDIGANSTVDFSTIPCTVKVNNVQGQIVNGAQVSYYSGSWRVIGLTDNGQVTKELLPATLSFRVSYAGKTQDKQQNLSANSFVEFIAQ